MDFGVQESSLWFGLCYIVASLAIYDEYSNDILDMSEGSCFPRFYSPHYYVSNMYLIHSGDVIWQVFDSDRPNYRKKNQSSQTGSGTPSVSRPSSFRNPPSRTASFNNPMIDLKPLEVSHTHFAWSQFDASKCNDVFYLPAYVKTSM